MKLKQNSPSKPKGIFGGVVFALVLGHVPFKQKETLRKKITANGGTISYIITKKCDFVICESNKEASRYGLKTAHKLGIPVVSSSYVDSCLAEMKLISTNICAQEQIVEKLKKLDDEFKTGKVSVKCEDELSIESSRKYGIGSTKQLKQWSFMDNKGPDFHNHPYSVASFTVLKGVPRRNGEMPFCIIEIQTSKVDDKTAVNFEVSDRPKFCIFVDFGTLFEANKGQNNKKLKSSVQTCRFTNQRNIAMDCYSQLHKTYTSPPHSMTYWSRNEAIPPFVGSAEFIKICESWMFMNYSLNEEVQKLVFHLWTTSYKYVEDILAGKIADIKLADVNKADGILFQISKELNDKSDPEFGLKLDKLSKNYFHLIHQRTQQELTSKTAIATQHRLLQMIRDILAISEGNDGKIQENSILAIYKSLSCWITHLQADSEEFMRIKEKVTSSQNGNTKNTLEVRNIFAVKRPAEDIEFGVDICNHQYLFHGCDAHNILGILSRGLVLHEMDYASDGNVNLLGNAIYFSSSSSASARYSSASKTTGARFMLFNEVALGKCFNTEKAMPELIKPPMDYQSVQGIPSENPSDSTFQGTEYAIFQESQQRLAYLIEFSFKDESVHILSDASICLPVNNLMIEDSNDSQETFSAYDAFDKLMFAKELKTQYGLQGIASNPIPLESVHIRASIVDLASKVIIFQEYTNKNSYTVEAKYVFPLDDLAAVCGFEAFINEKRVVGVIKEKEEAHKQYREAVAEGHGAYLMDESGQDVFTITIGNLPAFSRVVIKIIYVAELITENEHIVFKLSGCVAGDLNNNDTDLLLGRTAISSGVSPIKSSLQIGIEMPFSIRRIISPNHGIITKKTDTMATVKLCKGQNIANGFQLWIDLAEIHVPRMWVEKSENKDEVAACMLAFYPVFSDKERKSGTAIIMIDASNSMQKGAFQSAQIIALLILHYIRDNWKFNVIFFGSIYEELFPVPQLKTVELSSQATKFILEAKPKFGCTDLSAALRSYFLLPPNNSEGPENVFLVSDGNVNSSGLVLQNVAKHSSETRVFTFGVGSSRLPCNQHFMKTLANKGAGAYEYFDDQIKSKWRNKVKQQLYKASQLALTNIQVEWQQLDNNPVPPVQAPQKIVSLFNSARQVIYGFVDHCSMATLTAKVNDTILTTVVSTSELSKTQGQLLHCLTAKAIIRDWSDGLINEDVTKDEVTKTSMNSYIISLSQKYGILSSLTSYIAIEKRNEGDSGSPSCGPSLLDLVNNDNVDKLLYIEYDVVEEPEANTSDSALLFQLQSDELAAIEVICPEEKKCVKKKKTALPAMHKRLGHVRRNIPMFAVPRLETVEHVRGFSPIDQEMVRGIAEPSYLSRNAMSYSKGKANIPPILSLSVAPPRLLSLRCKQRDSSLFGSANMDLPQRGASYKCASMDLCDYLMQSEITRNTLLCVDPRIDREKDGDHHSRDNFYEQFPPVNHESSRRIKLSAGGRDPDLDRLLAGCPFEEISVAAGHQRRLSVLEQPARCVVGSSDDLLPYKENQDILIAMCDYDDEFHDMPCGLFDDDGEITKIVTNRLPSEKFVIDGKGNLPFCISLIKAISNCSMITSWPNNIWIRLKEDSPFKECELLALQSELDRLAMEDPIEMGPCHDIWRDQTAIGYFSMDSLDQWIYNGYALKITKILDNAGLQSLGGKREEVLNMCATIAAGLLLYKGIYENYFVERSVEDFAESEYDLERMFSAYLTENFNAKFVIMLLKAFTYIMWVYKRNPLLYKSLELGLKEKVYTWEAFLLFYFTEVTEP